MVAFIDVSLAGAAAFGRENEHPPFLALFPGSGTICEGSRGFHLCFCEGGLLVNVRFSL